MPGPHRTPPRLLPGSHAPGPDGSSWKGAEREPWGACTPCNSEQSRKKARAIRPRTNTYTLLRPNALRRTVFFPHLTCIETCVYNHHFQLLSIILLCTGLHHGVVSSVRFRFFTILICTWQFNYYLQCFGFFIFLFRSVLWVNSQR